MCVISITVVPPADVRPLVRAAFRTGRVPSAFRAAVEAGRPVFEEDLYGGRDFHAVADEIDALLGMLRSAGAEFVIREDGDPLAPDVLANILAEGRRHFEPPPA